MYFKNPNYDRPDRPVRTEPYDGWNRWDDDLVFVIVDDEDAEVKETE